MSILNGFSQQVRHQISYFSARDYGKGREAANWAGVQDKNGILYFGNAGGVLKYDGVSWEYIPVKQQGAWVKSLAVDDNRIYVGSQNEFGYLSPDKSGKLGYTSISDSLNESQKSFGNINRVFAWDNKVAFQSEKALFLFSNNRLTTILPETSFHLSFRVNNDLYVRQREIGLMRLSGGILESVMGGELFKDIGITEILPASDPQKIIIISREDGFWLVDRKSFKSTPLLTDTPGVFRNAEIYGAIKISGNRIALNTLSAGIIITDENFKILSQINKDNGLKVNGVLSILQDYQGNLWAGLDNGIAQIRDSSPVSVYGPESGITGNISAIQRFEGRLFVGTTEGLFVQKEINLVSTTGFELFSDFKKEIRALCAAEGTLLAGTQYGLFEIRNNASHLLDRNSISSVYYSERSGILFVSGGTGLGLYRYSGTWKKLMDIPEITENVIRIQEDLQSHGKVLWLGTALEGIIRLKLKNISDYVIDKYDSADGLEDNTWAIPLNMSNKLVFSQHQGLLEFIDEEVLKQQLPDSLKNLPEFNRGYFDFYIPDSSLNLLGIPVYTTEETSDRIYANLNGESGYFVKGDKLEWNSRAFTITDIGKANVFFHEDDGICWIGGDDGLIRFDEKKTKDYEIGFNSLITRVSCTGDSVLYYGNSSAESVAQKDVPVLGYKFNTLSFSFAAPFFEGQEKTLYSVVFIGQDKNFGPWLSDTKVTYSNLHEGFYTLKVRAKNVYGHISSESEYRFEVSPPWYRSFWSYLLYIVAFILFVFAGIRINSRRLIEKNRRLEEIILERTQEIKQKNVELENQKQEILDSINYAQRIQKAVLPDNELTKLWLGEHFILFRPKDIVSGDFYWATQYDKYVFFCVADCTGHGVPGAFMSMLCISFLNEVVLKEKITDSGEIFNRLRNRIIESLKQKGVEGEQKDGMDITLCILNRETLELQYSGANNPLYIIRKADKEPIVSDKQQELNGNILYEIKGDSMPIAIHVHMDPFKKNILNLHKDDRLYLFSDGIADQFGGPNGKKFMYKSFKASLLETCNLKMDKQLIEIERKIDDWMGSGPDSVSFEQVDDICMMGVKV